MSLGRYAILVLLLVVLGLITVWGHLRLLSVGYEVNDLRARRARLEEEVRVQERRVDAMATPGETVARVRTLGLQLVPPSRLRRDDCGVDSTRGRPGAKRTGPAGGSP